MCKWPSPALPWKRRLNLAMSVLLYGRFLLLFVAILLCSDHEVGEKEFFFVRILQYLFVNYYWNILSEFQKAWAVFFYFLHFKFSKWRPCSVSMATAMTSQMS